MEISIKGRKAARQPSQGSVPERTPWDQECLRSLGQCGRSRGAGRRQQESTDTKRADTHRGVPQHTVSSGVLGMGLLGLSIGVSNRARSPGISLQSQFAKPVVFGKALVRRIHPTISDPIPAEGKLYLLSRASSICPAHWSTNVLELIPKPTCHRAYLPLSSLLLLQAQPQADAPALLLVPIRPFCVIFHRIS